MRVLMVCLGNICRSPLAEGILRHKISQHGLSWEVDSAGTGHWHSGELPDRRSIEIARQYGIDITGQRARQFQPDDFERFERIFVMDRQNYRNVMLQAGGDEDRNKVDLILNQVYPGQNREVPDPYYDDDGFDQVFRMLNEACEAFIRKQLT